MFAFWVVWPPLHVSHCSSLLSFPSMLSRSSQKMAKKAPGKVAAEVSYAQSAY